MKNKKLIATIVDNLKMKKQTISFAESCTGGRLAASITSIGGASDIYNGSVVSYSNEIKRKWLKVSQTTLNQFGAVSKECVSEMLDGIIAMTDANYGVAVSGIAGPSGGSKEKPVGTVFVGIIEPNQTKEIHHCFFLGDRESIQERSVAFALELIIKKLNVS